MSAIFRLAAAFDLAMTCVHETHFFSWLPLGGGHLAQLGFSFAVALFAIEIKSVVDSFRKPPSDRPKPPKPPSKPRQKKPPANKKKSAEEQDSPVGKGGAPE